MAESKVIHRFPSFTYSTSDSDVKYEGAVGSSITLVAATATRDGWLSVHPMFNNSDIYTGVSVFINHVLYWKMDRDGVSANLVPTVMSLPIYKGDYIEVRGNKLSFCVVYCTAY